MFKRYNGALILIASVMFVIGVTIYVTTRPEEHHHAPTETEHECDDHDEAFHLSEQAKANLDLKTTVVEIRDYWKSCNIPAMITVQPGTTYVAIPSPVTGVVVKVFPYEGETVSANQPLFDLQLTDAELIDTQSDFLLTIQKLVVIRQEITRLEGVGGAVAGKELLILQYEAQQLDTELFTLQETLVLHGLTFKQVTNIEVSGKLLKYMTVNAPAEVYEIASFEVSTGQQVEVGDTLCMVADYANLYIEGKAFEEDAAALNKAAISEWPVTMMVYDMEVSGLELIYVANEIDEVSRVLRFYVALPNVKVFDQYKEWHRFIAWLYRPGQRVMLRVPTERWGGCIVLPADAIIKEGPVRIVYVQNGNSFEPHEVRVLYADQFDTVIERDGSLFPGDMVVTSGAYQIHLAMKNRDTNQLDPHAGHNH